MKQKMKYIILLLLLSLMLISCCTCTTLHDIIEMNEEDDWAFLVDIEATMSDASRLLVRFGRTVRFTDDTTTTTALQRQITFGMASEFLVWYSNSREDLLATLRDEFNTEQERRLATPYFAVVLYDKRHLMTTLEPHMDRSCIEIYGGRARIMRRLFRDLGLI